MHGARASVELNGQCVHECDGARVRDERQLALAPGEGAEVPNELPAL